MFRRWWNIAIPTPSLISSASGSVWVFISNFHAHEFISKMGLKTVGHCKVCPSTNATVCNVKCRCTLSLHYHVWTVLDTVLAEYLNCFILLTSWPGINLEHDKILSAKAFSPIAYICIYIYTFRAESLHCSRLVNLTPVTYIPSREIRIAGLVMKKKGVTFPILNDYSCGISVIGSWNCLLRMRSFSHCHGVAKEVAMGHVQRLNISTASVQKWYFNVTLRIMGSQVQWCFGDPKEPWKIQSQTPL